MTEDEFIPVSELPAVVDMLRESSLGEQLYHHIISRLGQTDSNRDGECFMQFWGRLEVVRN